MILKIEELIKTKFEARILTALPGLAVSDMSPVPDAPASLVSRIESRRPTRCVQEERNIRRYGEVEATLSATFYNRGQEFIDKSALLASFMELPFLVLSPDLSIPCELEESELAEGPHLDSDVWLFTITYPIYDIESNSAPEAAAVGGADTNAAAELYPREEAQDYGAEGFFK